MTVKGTQTERNLMAAFAGESQARNRYTYYASKARKEGFRQVSEIFEETADNERRHAKDEFALLNGIGNTATNLKGAIDGEQYETITMYPEFAKQAEADGNMKAAALFRMIAKVEEHHRDRYKKLLERVEQGTVYKREKPIKWKCSVCGYVHEGTEPPPKCPSCKHPKEYYEPANMDF